MSDSEVNSIIQANNTVSQFSTNDDSMNTLRGCLRYFYKITSPNVDTTSTTATGDAISPVQTSQDPTESETTATGDAISSVQTSQDHTMSETSTTSTVTTGDAISPKSGYNLEGFS